jgi:formylglycine-generating enzyme required for sulfatase activity
MTISRKLSFRFLLLLNFLPVPAFSQALSELGFEKNSGLICDRLILSDSNSILMGHAMPAFSFMLNKKTFSSGDVNTIKANELYSQIYEKNLFVTYRLSGKYSNGLVSELIFENKGTDTISVSNVLPFGADSSSVYITGHGTDELARACLFLPGHKAVRVILPDNAWESGYTSFLAGKGLSVFSLSRRTGIEGGQKKRYETILPPNSKVIYTIHTEVFTGDWQNGLRIVCRDRYLFDLENFENSLYTRSDLKWIKESYLIVLQMAWDRDFFDRVSGRYTYADQLKKYNELFGNIDVYGIWPTWPRLGLDQRNQWDLYADLPGGTAQLRNFAKLSRQSGTRFFIAYNPWDNSTRLEDHYKGMARLISETEADGVVLDTKGSSSLRLQTSADSVRKGVVMYSEGQAIPKDMPGIISGRVHNAIFLSPELNLNKLIKPDFSIFRVCDVGEDILHREIAIAFFNGYGTELNMFRPGGRDENFRSDLDFLSKTTFILRQNNDAFLDNNWTPLIKGMPDKVYVNRWVSGDKTLYSILNMKAEGVDGKLIALDTLNRKHYVSLWSHENMVFSGNKGKVCLKSNIAGWQSSYTGTRREGSVECIAELPDLIRSRLIGDSIKISGKGLKKLLIWKGNPSYQTLNKEFHLHNDTTIRVKDIFGFYEGKIVLQFIENKRLKDENILTLRGGKPWLVSRTNRTERISSIPPDMVFIPGSGFSYKVSSNDEFIPYPDVNENSIKIDSFLIDKYPVTNAQYFEFVLNSGYKPADTSRYLRNWESGTFRQGQEKYPVVYISYEDMQAYCKWAQKRLPTEAEWQLASQGLDKRKWPWGDEFHGTSCNNSFDRLTPVDAFAKGQSPFGVFDLVGNVWQMTNDMYFNGTDYFAIIRGGSYYKPESSWWYIQGGPQPLDKTQIMLMVSPGFDRSSTVGFRCVKDIDKKDFKEKKKK